MERIRATLYRIAATLFERPIPERIHRISSLIASLLYKAPADAPWLQTLAAIAQQLRYEQDLLTEHTRLFVLSASRIAAQPYESYWLRDAIEPGELRAVHRRRACCGRCNLVPDHIVSELELMACLIEEGEINGRQMRFLFQRLHCWAPRFCSALQAAEPPPAVLYELAADLLKQLLEWDKRYFEKPPPPSVILPQAVLLKGKPL